MRDFPQELIDHTIDFVAVGCYSDDPPDDPMSDLKACTMVATNWRPKAQAHCFFSNNCFGLEQSKKLHATLLQASPNHPLHMYVKELSIHISTLDMADASSAVLDILQIVERLKSLTLYVYIGRPTLYKLPPPVDAPTHELPLSLLAGLQIIASESRVLFQAVATLN